MSAFNKAMSRVTGPWFRGPDFAFRNDALLTLDAAAAHGPRPTRNREWKARLPPTGCRQEKSARHRISAQRPVQPPLHKQHHGTFITTFDDADDTTTAEDTAFTIF